MPVQFCVMTKKNSHELITGLRTLASELQRTPTRDEFFKSPHASDKSIRDVFGTYTALVQAAGLDPVKPRRNIDNSIFKRDLERHLETYEPRGIEGPKPFPTAAIISDIHFPFESKRVIDRFLEYVEKEKPQFVIINGDAFDHYSHSRYPRSHNIFTPREEERLAREKNETFWRDVQKRSPSSRCIQLLGNHCVRPLKQVLEHYPAAEDWVKEYLTKLMTFDGVETIMDPREEFHLTDEIIVFHGYRSKLGDHRDYTLKSCFTGHTHKGGVVWRSLANGRQVFECNSGVAGDPESKGLSYTSQRIHDMTPGFAVLTAWGPMFVPA